MACAVIGCGEQPTDANGETQVRLLTERVWGNGEITLWSPAFPYHVGPPKITLGSDTIVSHRRLGDTAAFRAPGISETRDVRLLGLGVDSVVGSVSIYGFGGGHTGPPLWDERILPWPLNDPQGTFLATDPHELMLIDPASGSVVTRYPPSVHDPSIVHEWMCPTIPGPSYDPKAVTTCTSTGIHLWRLTPGFELLDSIPAFARFGAAAINPGIWLLSHKHWLNLFDSTGEHPFFSFKEEGYPPVLSPRGDRVVIPAVWDTLKVFDTQGPTVAWQSADMRGALTNATFTGDGSAVLLTVGRTGLPGTVFIADAGDGDLLATVEFCARAAAADLSGELLLLLNRASRTEYTMRVLDAGSYETLTDLTGTALDCAPESQAYWTAGVTVSTAERAAFAVLTDLFHLGDTTWAPSPSCILRFDLMYSGEKKPH